jgi:hypothetical protein
MSDQAPGNGSPNPPTGTSAPTALDEEAVSRIASQTLNSVFTGRSKKLQADIVAELDKKLEPFTKKLEDFMAASTSGGKPAKKGKDGEPDDATPEYKGLQRQLQEQKMEHEKLLSKLKESEDRAQATALRQSLAEELSKHGISDALRVKGAIAMLFSDGKVRRDEDGRAVFAESEDSLIDLATGIKAWAKTDDAKIFLPPAGTRGSGGGPGQSPPKADQKPGEASAYDIGMAIASQFGGTPIGT